jgi:hypothetical protein
MEMNVVQVDVLDATQLVEYVLVLDVHYVVVVALLDVLIKDVVDLCA